MTPVERALLMAPGEIIIHEVDVAETAAFEERMRIASYLRVRSLNFEGYPGTVIRKLADEIEAWGWE